MTRNLIGAFVLGLFVVGLCGCRHKTETVTDMLAQLADDDSNFSVTASRALSEVCHQVAVQEQLKDALHHSSGWARVAKWVTTEPKLRNTALFSEAMGRAVEVLTDGEVNERMAVCSTIIDVGPDASQAMPVLTTFLQASDGDIPDELRELTTDALVSIGEASLPAFIRALPLGNDARRHAINGLVSLGDCATVMLLEIASSYKGELRVSALTALAGMKEKPPIVLLTLLSAISDDATREFALDGLPNSRDAVVPLYLMALEHRDADVRHTAISKVTGLQDSRYRALAIGKLTAVLRNEDEPLANRLIAMSTLGTFGKAANSSVSEALPLLELPDDDIRAQVLVFLDQAGATPPQCGKAMINALNFGGDNAWKWTRHQLRRYGEEILPYVTDALLARDTPLRVREELFSIWREAEQPGSDELGKKLANVLGEKLDNGDADERIRILELIRQCEGGVDAAVIPIIRLLDAADTSVRSAAEVVLRETKDSADQFVAAVSAFDDHWEVLKSLFDILTEVSDTAKRRAEAILEPRLSELLVTGEDDEVVGALSILGRFSKLEKKTLDRILAQFGSNEANLRKAAILASSGIHSVMSETERRRLETILEPMLSELLLSSEIGEVVDVLSLLGEFSECEQKTLDRILDLFRSGDAELRELAIRTCGWLPAGRYILQLISLLDDEDLDVRELAYRTLHELGPEIVPYASQVLQTDETSSESLRLLCRLLGNMVSPPIESKKLLHAVETNSNAMLASEARVAQEKIQAGPQSPDFKADVGDDRNVASIKSPGIVRGVVYSPDGAHIAVARPHEVQVWSTEGAKQLEMKEKSSELWDLDFSSDGDRIATISRNVRIWNATNGEELSVIARRVRHVGDVAFSPNGVLIAATVSSPNGQIAKTWDATTGQEKLVLGEASRLCFSTDGARIATVSHIGARIHDSTSGRELVSIPIDGGGDVAFSPDGKSLAISSSRYESAKWSWIRIYDAKTGELFGDLSRLPDSVCRVAFSPDGRWLAAVCGDLRPPCFAIVWDAHTFKQFYSFRHPRHISLTCLGFSPDGQLLATGGITEGINPFDIGSGHDNSLQVWILE